jgi:hypothetical protein
VGIEELGIPTVVIVQKYFVEDARATGEAFGLENLCVAVVQDTFTGLTSVQVHQTVDQIIEDIITGLTRPIPESKESLVQRVNTPGPRDEMIEFTGSDLLDCFKKMNDKFLDWGWSDGFPLIPPTEKAVNEMLEGTKRPPDDIVVEKFVPGTLGLKSGILRSMGSWPGANRSFYPWSLRLWRPCITQILIYDR